ncbi:TniQ family protein, partial [Edaphosphingomonas haloaromaticamans]
SSRSPNAVGPAAMLYEVTPVTRPPPRVVPLPIMVDPMEGEALISWCHRLAARLGLRLHQTARMLGVDTSDPAWWHRPGPEVLLAISRRTGVGMKRLRAMTFLDWKGLSSQRNPGHIVGRWSRDLVRPRADCSPHCVACPQCLVDDREPWVRLDWLTGWASLCPVHGTVLIERCRKCHAPLRMPTLEVNYTPTLGTCHKCGARHCDAPLTIAHPPVLELQEKMLRAMREGKARFPGLRTCAWSTMVALVAQISWTLWQSRDGRRRLVLFVRIAQELGLPPTQSGSGSRAYELMLILVWMLRKPSERWSVILGVKPDTEQASEVVMRLPMRQRTRLLNILSVDATVRRQAYMRTLSDPLCQTDCYPDSDTLQRHGAVATSEPIYRKLLAIARCREGASVEAIVDESNHRRHRVDRWWHKYRPETEHKAIAESASPSRNPLAKV